VFEERKTYKPNIIPKENMQKKNILYAVGRYYA